MAAPSTINRRRPRRSPSFPAHRLNASAEKFSSPAESPTATLPPPSAPLTKSGSVGSSVPTETKYANVDATMTKNAGDASRAGVGRVWLAVNRQPLQIARIVGEKLHTVLRH